MLLNLETDRLILIPVTYEITSELSNGGTKEVEKLGLRTNGKWPRQDTMDILPFVNRAFEESEKPSGYEFWMMALKENMNIIGDIGFKGKPDENGEVEIGYGIIEEEHGRGYGTEALRVMLKWALGQQEVTVVKADCLIDNIPSIKILEKCGMKEINRDEELIYWELRNI